MCVQVYIWLNEHGENRVGYGEQEEWRGVRGMWMEDKKEDQGKNSL